MIKLPEISLVEAIRTDSSKVVAQGFKLLEIDLETGEQAVLRNERYRGGLDLDGNLVVVAKGFGGPSYLEVIDRRVPPSHGGSQIVIRHKGATRELILQGHQLCTSPHDYNGSANIYDIRSAGGGVVVPYFTTPCTSTALLYGQRLATTENFDSNVRGDCRKDPNLKFYDITTSKLLWSVPHPDCYLRAMDGDRIVMGLDTLFALTLSS